MNDTDTMTRSEHMAWAKRRALEALAYDGPREAFASLTSDLQKRSETVGHPGLELGMMMLLGGMLNTPQQMREWIEGFN